MGATTEPMPGELDPGTIEFFSRWPGILRLSLTVLLGPTAVLVNQELIYLSNMWACGLHAWAAIHLVPILCLVLCVGAGLTAYNDWRRVGGGLEVEHGSRVISRTRFLSICGMATSTFAALLTIAQWFAVFMFPPCMRL
jgi:hypothetical protein